VEITGSPSFVSYDSILLHHGHRTPRAFLLLHGLTASPLQFEAFGHLLYERGSNVYIPRLPRHGLSDRLTTALEDLTADELRTFAGACARHAAAYGERVTVLGFSVGGLLSAWIGQHVAVERSVSLAPFFGVAGIPNRLMPQMARATLGSPNRFLWWDPVRRERHLPVHGYPRFATHAVAHAVRLAGELFEAARRSAPAARDLQFVLNTRETTVSNRAALRLARLWAAHGTSRVGIHRLHGLPASHDIIEPLRSPRLTRRVYPALLALLER
jgi:alpha-beta hydrolase superfamily lysophospholipase